MGTSLTPIAVRLDRLTTVLGSKDLSLVEAVIKKFGDDFEQYDEMGENIVEYYEDAEPITMREALTHLVMGEEYNPRVGFMYRFALQFICQSMGTKLPRDRWCSLRGAWGWFTDLDETLEALGVPEERFRVQKHLVKRGSPVPVPEHDDDGDDAPYIGYLTLDEIKAAWETLDEAKFLAIEPEYLRGGISEALTWFRVCLKRKKDLICFYC